MEPDKTKPKRPIRLPFDKQNNRGDWGGWIYVHRAGILSTVIVYLVGAIMFLSYRIVINENQMQMINFELQKEPEPPKPQELTPEQIKQEQELKRQEQEFEKIQNKVSDANSKLNSELKDSKRSDASEIYEEAERINRELAAGREAYEKGLKQLAAGQKSAKAKAKADAAAREKQQETGNQRTNMAGAVTIEYDLENRHDVYLHRPTYQCQYAGTVVVSITVNRNGKVTSASVQDIRSDKDDDCIGRMGVQSALASKFNASQSAPDKQKGTITYKFFAQ